MKSQNNRPIKSTHDTQDANETHFRPTTRNTHRRTNTHPHRAHTGAKLLTFITFFIHCTQLFQKRSERCIRLCLTHTIKDSGTNKCPTVMFCFLFIETALLLAYILTLPPFPLCYLNTKKLLFFTLCPVEGSSIPYLFVHCRPSLKNKNKGVDTLAQVLIINFL